MASQQLTESYDAAVKAQAQHPAEAIRLFRDIALGSHPNDADSVKVRTHWAMVVCNLQLFAVPLPGGADPREERALCTILLGCDVLQHFGMQSKQ